MTNAALIHKTIRGENGQPLVIENPEHMDFFPGERERDWREITPEEWAEYRAHWENVIDTVAREARERVLAGLQKEHGAMGEVYRDGSTILAFFAGYVYRITGGGTLEGVTLAGYFQGIDF